MDRAIEVVPRSSWPAGEAVGSVVLDFDSRHRRRVRLTCDNGLHVLLDLPKAAAIRDGDGLRLEEGGWVVVRAAHENLLCIAGRDPHHLHRIAWHLGNRHCPAEIQRDRILIREDHVLAEMLRGLGAEVTEVRAPFDPERGAYHQESHAHAHGHGHGHDQGHDHDHDADGEGHAHEPA